MKTQIQVYVIDSENRTIKEAKVPSEMPGRLTGLQKLVGGYIMIAHQFENGDVLLVDENGLNKPRNGYFAVKDGPEPFVGKGVIVGTRGEEFVAAKSEISAIEAEVSFISAEQHSTGLSTKYGPDLFRIETFRDYDDFMRRKGGRVAPGSMLVCAEDAAPDEKPATPKYTGKPVRRKDRCPCGSGRKFKRCCGQ